MKIEAGRIHYCHLPKDHPIKVLCEEEKFDLKMQERVMRAMEETLDRFLDSLIDQREKDLHEVVNNIQQTLVEPLPEDTNPIILGPDGETPL
jgi:hypothetical protein